MSNETAHWLNTMTLIGDTDRRGTAWHYRADLQEGAGNHFSGAIPTERISDLFAPWEPVEVPLYVNPADADPRFESAFEQVNARKMITSAAMMAEGKYDALGVFSSDYQIHGYNEWLLNNVVTMFDGDVHPSSAGLLANGGVGWVELSLHDMPNVNGFEFKPHLLAYTSVNGKFATTYKRAVQAVVCDNTLSAAVGERTAETVKVKHSKYSALKIQDARDALGIILAVADDFSKEIEKLCATKVDDKTYNRVIDTLIPLDVDTMSKMAATKAEQKRDRIRAMYLNDSRCAPWNGTAFGIIQTVNTYNHHEKQLRSSGGEKTIRAERNMLSAIDGTTDKETTAVMNALATAGVAV